MAFDGFFTRKVVAELNSELQFGRINKINNISSSELIFTIRKNSTKKLLISINPQSSRIHLTNNSYENPKSPSNFCTVLRKYLSNGFIVNFEQINNDRVIFLHIKNSDELGYEKNYVLIIELMGKHSNVILTDSDFAIIEAIKNSYDIEYSRATIANAQYKLPPTKEKLNPFACSFENIEVDNTNKKFLLDTFYGTSSLVNNYFKHNIASFEQFITNFDEISTPLIFTVNKKKDFYFFAQDNFTEKTEFQTYSELLDFYYLDSYKNDSNKNNNKKLYTFIKNKISRLHNKINILTKEIAVAESDTESQLKGQLLLANNYLFQKFTPKEVTLQNFYSENLEDITIALDENLSIEQNAENYFNLNKKNKRTVENLLQQIDLAAQEINYFEMIEVQLENAETTDVEEITEELVNNGYLKVKVSKKNKKPKYTVINYNGTAIYVGKNNIQNDAITNKLAKRGYLWFHAKDIPGSHVVIFSDNPTESEMKIAANLAAFYSKFKNEQYVNVDYTLIKYVKKIAGAKPGMVTYTNQTTLKIVIDKHLINSLLQN